MTIRRGDLTAAVEAIVNAANNDLILGGGGVGVDAPALTVFERVFAIKDERD